MRVLIVVDPVLPTPPERYGGTHRIAAAVCRGLVRSGHTITVIAGKGSHIDGARLLTQRYRYPAPRWLRASWYLWFVLRMLVLSRRTDVIVHFWREDFLRGALPHNLPLIVTHHDPVCEPEIDITTETVRVSVSDDQRSELESGRWVTIHNGVDTQFLTPDPHRKGGYLAFLGRLSPEKGGDTAVRVAQAAGMRLRIGGNLPASPESKAAFEADIAPGLSDEIQWLGELDDDQKRDLLRGADALLFPIRWREPFGLVMAEALACGTPVIALRAGSTPEVVRHGETGFLCDDEQQMVAAVRRIAEIDRRVCRQDAVERFSEQKMVGDYIRLIEEMVR